MKLLSRFFKKAEVQTSLQSVVLYLDGISLPEEVYREFDLAGLEDRLEQALRNSAAGVLEGNEFNPGETLVFLYGSSAERIFEEVEPVLREHPLCSGARVELRDEGRVLRELRLAE